MTGHDYLLKWIKETYPLLNSANYAELDYCDMQIFAVWLVKLLTTPHIKNEIMTNEEIIKHIETNCRNEHGEPMMDEQAFYEGAKWYREQQLKILNIPVVKEPDESKMKDKTFELAERLADEAFGSKGVIEYSSRQELTVKFYEMLKEPSIELYSKAVICAERYKHAAKAEEDLTAAFEALVKNHNEIKEWERTI
ncbi:MAG: hypothetical protein RBT65_18195, partial [Methanolobus sp.]|nr:hypothetical protein [Methanolobus sp.]